MQDHVLVVVEDDPDLMAGWKDLFEFSGYKVYGYTSATAALTDREALSQASLLITDFHLGDINGVTLIRKAREINQQLPALVLTGLKQDDVAKTIQREPNVGMFYKPVDIFAVEDYVAAVLARNAADRPAE